MISNPISILPIIFTISQCSRCLPVPIIYNGLELPNGVLVIHAHRKKCRHYFFNVGRGKSRKGGMLLVKMAGISDGNKDAVCLQGKCRIFQIIPIHLQAY